ncbi:PAS domain-containing sensor histidine kinase [Metabacillus arenae]|uniref:histidine kinase n=1 Tax=Metabacillus arenae TaxID=2771434 RepID=A0A926NE51_9BACI|nr:PAS domain-containing sensor histidine kinase [Metabacillus arenae]MBD1379571.1 PAS domain S-box protein [Metabacillus arenae]
MSRKKKVVLLYFGYSLLWIFATDGVLWLLNQDLMEFILLQKLKAIIYIILSSCFIYYLIIGKEELDSVKKEKEKLRTLINSMVDFVCFKDGEGRWLQTNDFGKKLFYLEKIDYKGKKDSELADCTGLFHEAYKYCEQSDEQTWQAGVVTRSEEVIPQLDGCEKTFDTIKVPLFNNDGTRKGLVAIGRDITERKNTEKRLCQSQQSYKSLFEYNPELVYMVDLNGKITNLNPMFEKITGYNREEYIGEPILQIVAKEDQTRVKDSFYNVIETRESWSDQEIQIFNDQSQRVVLNCSFVPMVIDNEVVGVIGYAKDITKLKATEERLRKVEKLSVVGELAASVAHEIRNPLTSLKGFVQLLKGNDGTNDAYYKIMNDELDRINEIVSELLVLAKPQDIRFQIYDLKAVLSSVVSLLESQANLYGVEIDLKSQTNFSFIKCEPNQLKQLFINIIKNSIEASSTKVEIAINKLEDHLAVRIKDNGTGIEKERLSHLGEPFYSMKEKGTGLGLTVSYRIVESHKGKITFESNVGRGTTVEVLLPSHEGEEVKRLG